MEKIIPCKKACSNGTCIPMKRYMVPALLLLTLLLSASDQPVTPRLESWARPIVLEGVPNLHQVSDILYRSAQPTATGMKNLRKMGISTVISLRAGHSDRNLVKGSGLVLEEIPMRAWHISVKQALRFLRIVTDPRRQPVLIHCQHGADRTGVMCGVYRTVVQGWHREDAVREMTEGGFGFHSIWRNLPAWLRKLNVTRLRRSIAGVRRAVPLSG